jgi:hypothetical protein
MTWPEEVQTTGSDSLPSPAAQPSRRACKAINGEATKPDHCLLSNLTSVVVVGDGELAKSGLNAPQTRPTGFWRGQ